MGRPRSHHERWFELDDAGGSPYLSFHQGGGELVPTIDFVSRLVGYVSSEGQVPGAIFTTTNAGTTWSRVLTPGVAPSFLATASTLAVVSDICSHPRQSTDFNSCPNDLSLYRVGATTPWRTVRIPRTSNVANRHAQLFAIVSSNTFVMSEGEPGGAVSTAVFRFQNPATPESRGVTSTTPALDSDPINWLPIAPNGGSSLASLAWA